MLTNVHQFSLRKNSICIYSWRKVRDIKYVILKNTRILPLQIVEINQQLLEADNAAWVNESPYQKGWMIKIKPNDITEFEELLNSDDYKALLGL